MDSNYPFLIVGLGNPGTKYANTYHNLGFIVLDRLVGDKPPVAKEKFGGVEAEFQSSPKVLLFKPLKYMNLSGGPVSDIVNFYKVPVATNLLVVSDDLDLPPGQLRLRLSGGPGGHNGLTSIIEALGTEEFPRLRIGIGRSQTMATEHHVLAPIPKAQHELFRNAVDLAVSGIKDILQVGVSKAMNKVNQKREV